MSIFPTYVRAWIFICIAFVAAFLFLLMLVRKTDIIERKDLVYWAAFTFIITAAAFLSNSILIFTIVVASVCMYILRRKKELVVPYYLALIPLIPMYNYEIPGLVPGIRYLFAIDYPKMFALFLLIPLYLEIRQRSAFFRGPAYAATVDKLVFSYFFCLSILAFREGSLTASMRSVLIYFLEIVLPYFVISRCARDEKVFSAAFFAIFGSAVLLACVSVLEQRFRWEFYDYLLDLLDFKKPTTATHYYVRGGWMRVGTTMGVIPFGYFLALALGVGLYLLHTLKTGKLYIYMGTGLISIALFFTGSRGAWLAAIVILITHFYFRLKFGGRAALVAVGLMLAAVAFLYEPNLDSIDEHGTVRYRLDLIENSMRVISNHFVFGTPNPKETAALEASRQGQGIIDIVNTYLAVVLYYGMVGLALFVLIFAVQIVKVHSATKLANTHGRTSWMHIGNLLLAMLIATTVFIGTVSSISFIPVYYWSLLGLSTAYVRFQFANKNTDKRARGWSSVVRQGKDGVKGYLQSSVNSQRLSKRYV